MTIPTVRYTAGEHRAVVWPGGVVLLDSSVPTEVAAATWERLRNLPVPSTLDAVLTEVAEAIGARLLDLPPFAIAVTTGPAAAHVATRGPFEIEVTSADLGTTRVSGTGVATWSERQLASVVRMRIGTTGDATDAGELPVGSAVVSAHLVVVAESMAAPARAAAPDDLSDFGDPRDSDATSRADDSGHWVGLADAAAGRPAAEVTPPTSSEVGVGPVPHVQPSPEAQPEVPPRPEPEERPAAPDRPIAEPTNEPSPHSVDFDDVWSDYTLAGSVEGAAVRPGAEPASGPAEPRPSPVKDVTWMGEDDENEEVDGERGVPELVTPAPSRGDGKPPTLAPPSDFISSVPGMPPIAPPPAPPPPVTAPPPLPPLVPPLRPGPPPDRPGRPSLGDHDGETIAGPVRQAEPPPEHRAADDAVLGVLCPSAHGNPPQRAHCRVCGSALTGAATRIPQPSLGRVIASTGEQAELTGPVIIGRAPRASRFQGTSVPRLMTLPQPHISASHVALRVEGWSVLAVDLSSTNGTFLRRNGEPPFRILEQPQLLVAGDVIDLGHGVHLRFEELP